MKTARQIGMRTVRKARKLWLAAFAALCACAATAATYTVSTVEELTNAVDKINRAGGSGGTIRLNPGRYDLSTLGPTTNMVGSTMVWGTMSTPDGSTSGGAGKSCLWFRYPTHFVGVNSEHWSRKTSEQEVILDGGGVASIIYPYTGSGRGSSFYHVTFTNGVASSGKGGGGSGGESNTERNNSAGIGGWLQGVAP